MKSDTPGLSPAPTLLYDLKVDALPPSTNDMYTVAFHGVKLSGAAKKFKIDANMAILEQLDGNGYIVHPDERLLLHLIVTKPDLYNETYPKSTPNRFKRWDGSNLIKLMEDVVARALGFDDCLFLDTIVSKRLGPVSIQAKVWLIKHDDPVVLW